MHPCVAWPQVDRAHDRANPCPSTDSLLIQRRFSCPFIRSLSLDPSSHEPSASSLAHGACRASRQFHTCMVAGVWRRSVQRTPPQQPQSAAVQSAADEAGSGDSLALFGLTCPSFVLSVACTFRLILQQEPMHAQVRHHAYASMHASHAHAACAALQASMHGTCSWCHGT